MLVFNILIAPLLLFSCHASATSLTESTTSCNPLSTSSCSPDDALATDISEYFTSNSSYFDIVSTETGVSFDDDGLKLTLSQRYDNPSIKSTFYIMFGRVEVHFKAANGTGIISSFYLQSDDLDEIDIELFGSDDTQFQSNYFSKGNTTTYDRGEYHSTSDAPQDSYHNYTIDWTAEELIWYLDGVNVRTLKNTSSEGYPQTPMYIMAGIWAGGDSSNAEGTIEWAGGLTDYTQGPFQMFINKLIVSDYSTGDSYSYGDQSGDWTSIKANNGKILGRIDDVDIEGNDESSTKVSTNSSSKLTASTIVTESSNNALVSKFTEVDSTSSTLFVNSSTTTGEEETSSISKISAGTSSSSSTASVATSENSSHADYILSPILIVLSLFCSAVL